MTEALPAPEEYLPENTKVQHRPPCAHSVNNRIFEPRDASVILVTGEGGTGKTQEMVEHMYDLASKLHFYVLTNIIFLQKTSSSFRQVMRPHDRVRHINSMRELWYEYAVICKEYQAQHPGQLAGPVVVVVLDEWTKYMKRLAIYEKVVLATLMWWGENRKYQTVPVTITQKMGNAPRQLLPYMKWHIQKSEALTQQYNAKKGRSYHCKELGFVIRVRLEDELEKRKEGEFYLEEVAGVLQVGTGPWTKPFDRLKVGDISYDRRGSANFIMGEVHGTEDWFEDFMKEISSCPGMMVPDKILQFFESGPDRSSQLNQVRPVDIAKHVYRQHREEMPPEDEGHPVLKLGTVNRKRVRIPLNWTNLERIFKCPHTTLAREMEKET